MNQSTQTNKPAQDKHPKNLAHHFDSHRQQFDAAKLGMWTFLATEVLMFGGLFCAYAVYRSTHPEIFIAGKYFLDTNMGALNTIVLIASSFTMAWAVRCAQMNKQRALVILLSLTLLGGAIFMGVKYIEYKAKWEHGLFIGKFYNPNEDYFAAHFNSGGHEDQDAKDREAKEAEDHEAGEKKPAPTPTEYVPNATRGRMVFSGTCSSCHAEDGTGIVKQGANLLEGGFIASKTEQELLTFLKLGRSSWDPDSKMKLQMPPKGGNPALTEEHLKDVVAYMKVLVEEDAVTQTPTIVQADPDQADSDPAPELSAADLDLLIPRSTLTPPAQAPQGLSDVYFALNETPQNPASQVKPADLRMFFSIYFLLTGLHGFHVLVGMFVLLWLIIRSLKGHFGPGYYTPVDMGGLYWHLVDLIWIFVFPLLYLIH